MFSPQTKYKPLSLKIRDEETVDEKILTPGHSAKPSLMLSELKGEQILRYSSLRKPDRFTWRLTGKVSGFFLKVHPS